MHIRGCVRALVARIIEQREACGSRKERDGARLSFLDFVPERVGICRRALCTPATSCLETLPWRADLNLRSLVSRGANWMWPKRFIDKYS
jgi:hypothetical protein